VGRTVDSYDVIVVGGGPGGSATATRLAQHGRRVLLLERDPFPRFHIGESQLPWSDEIFRTLGVEQAIAGAGFVDKWGATFITSDGGAEQYADFAVAPQTPRPQTYQVSRDEFDRVLLTHARATGADVRQPAQAVDVTFAADGVTMQQFNEGAGGQVVFHLHVHIIPRKTGVAMKPPASAKEKPDVLAEQAKKLAAAIAAG